MKNKQTKRMIITVGIIFVVALTGMIMINDTSAQQGTNIEKVITTQSTAEMNHGLVGDKTSVSAISTAGDESLMMPILKMVGALAVVILAIYCGVFLLRKSMGRRFSGNRLNKSLEVMETTFIAPRKSVSLIRIANRSVLVGVTDQQISILTELDAETTREISLAQTVEAESKNDFGDLLRTASGKLKMFAGQSQSDGVTAKA